jgi:hypothetical protein
LQKSTDPFFAYDANYLIDNKAGIIVDAEGTRANRIAEIAITETMIERVKSRFDTEHLPAAGRILPWDQAEPSSEVPSSRENIAGSDCRHYRGRDDKARPQERSSGACIRWYWLKFDHAA